MSKPIEIDLRRDLPKVREQLEALVEHVGACFYSSPCAVGAMMTPDQRTALRSEDSTRISVLVEAGKVIVPDDEQRRDLIGLQHSFDCGDPDYFESALARLEAKYLTGEVG